MEQRMQEERGKKRQKGGKKVIDSAVALVCRRAALRLYQSSSDRCPKRIPLSCFTWGRRSARLYLTSITGWQGAGVTGSSSLEAGATLAMHVIPVKSGQHTITILIKLIAKNPKWTHPNCFNCLFGYLKSLDLTIFLNLTHSFFLI